MFTSMNNMQISTRISSKSIFPVALFQSIWKSDLASSFQSNKSLETRGKNTFSVRNRIFIRHTRLTCAYIVAITHAGLGWIFAIFCVWPNVNNYYYNSFISFSLYNQNTWTKQRSPRQAKEDETLPVER